MKKGQHVRKHKRRSKLGKTFAAGRRKKEWVINGVITDLNPKEYRAYMKERDRCNIAVNRLSENDVKYVAVQKRKRQVMWINEFVGEYITTSGVNVDESRTDGNWVRGTVDGYRFCAKVFGGSSSYGIRDGRISKLNISNSCGNEIYNYDRGLDFTTREAQPLVRKLLRAFPKNGL